MTVISFEFTPESKKFLNNLSSVATNMRLEDMFNLIGDTVRQEWKGVFESSNSGFIGRSVWDDLADSTKQQKQRKVGFVYPILTQKGTLKDSFINKSSGDNINEVSSTGAEFGSSLYYAIYHQEGTNKMSQRKIIEESKGLNIRVNRIVDTHLKKIFNFYKIEVE